MYLLCFSVALRTIGEGNAQSPISLWKFEAHMVLSIPFNILQQNVFLRDYLPDGLNSLWDTQGNRPSAGSSETFSWSRIYRAEHSMGVAHLAYTLANQVYMLQGKELDISRSDVKCAEVCRCAYTAFRHHHGEHAEDASAPLRSPHLLLHQCAGCCLWTWTMLQRRRS